MMLGIFEILILGAMAVGLVVGVVVLTIGVLSRTSKK